MEQIGLRELTQRFAQAGRLQAICLRPQRDAPARLVDSVEALEGRGLAGDRSADRAPAAPHGKRQVTLIQAEHLPLIAAWCRLAELSATDLRRNLVVSGLNLLGARSPFADRPLRVHIGAAVVLEISGPCDPCSKMEVALGRGVTARVLHGGTLAVGDALRIEPG